MPSLPGLKNAVAVSAGGNYNLALVGNGPPFLTRPPVGRAANLGETVLFRVAAAGAWPLSYQWQHSGTNLPGATNTYLRLENLAASQTGFYSVVVSNRYGQVASAGAALNTPRITTAPQPQSTFLGGSAIFEVTAQGATPLHYQWTHSGTNLPGATHRTLQLENVHWSQAGPYAATVRNAYGEVTSEPADLSVGCVAAWGWDAGEQCDVPAALNDAVAVAGGMLHSLALKADGTVLAWGSWSDSDRWADQWVPATVPADLTNVVALAGGFSHSLALRADGKVVGWGSNRHGESSVPAGLGPVVAIAAGGDYSLALQADGTAAAWGDTAGPLTVPMGLSDLVAIAGGTGHCLALKADGTVTSWGDWVNDDGDPIPAIAPPDLRNVVAIAAGESHDLALRADGTVVAWGRYLAQGEYEPMGVPAGLSNVVAIASGAAHCLALQADGTLRIWGDSGVQQLEPPAGLHAVVAIAAAGGHSLALIGDPRTAPTLDQPTWRDGRFSVSVPTARGTRYRLEFKNSLDDSRWTLLPPRPGDDRQQEFNDRAPNPPSRFYRVRVD